MRRLNGLFEKKSLAIPMRRKSRQDDDGRATSGIRFRPAILSLHKRICSRSSRTWATLYSSRAAPKCEEIIADVHAGGVTAYRENRPPELSVVENHVDEMPTTQP